MTLEQADTASNACRGRRRALRRSLTTALAGLLVVAGWLSSGATTGAQSPPAGFPPRAVIALAGTPHLLIADEAGVLHWGGDTRALAGRAIDWRTRITLTADQLRAAPRGVPWLSAGLVAEGERLSLAKWETNEAAPTLLHVATVADLELLGIDETNYGALVVTADDWEQRFGFLLSGLPRGEYVSSAASPSTAEASIPDGPPGGTPSPAPSATASPAAPAGGVSGGDSGGGVVLPAPAATATATSTATTTSTATATPTRTATGTHTATATATPPVVSFISATGNLLAVDPARRRLYAAISGQSTFGMEVIDTATNRVVASVAIGAVMRDVTANVATGRVYVATDAGVVVVDGGTHAVLRTLGTAAAVGVTANRTTNRVYVAWATGSVGVYDGATDTLVTTVALPGSPVAAAANETTNRVYVSVGAGGSSATDAVVVIDGGSHTVSAIVPLVGSAARGLAVGERRNRVFVHGDWGSGQGIVAIDGDTSTVAGVLNTALNPVNRFGVDNATDHLFVPLIAGGGVGRVEVWSAATNSLVRTLYLGGDPLAAAADSTARRVYVSNTLAGGSGGPAGISVVQDWPD